MERVANMSKVVDQMRTFHRNLGEAFANYDSITGQSGKSATGTTSPLAPGVTFFNGATPKDLP